MLYEVITVMPYVEGETLRDKIDRITSYNVCYTKLLRVVGQVDGGHAALAQLALEPAPPEACRLLELGCADGGNLVAMAHDP